MNEPVSVVNKQKLANNRFIIIMNYDRMSVVMLACFHKIISCIHFRYYNRDVSITNINRLYCYLSSVTYKPPKYIYPAQYCNKYDIAFGNLDPIAMRRNHHAHHLSPSLTLPHSCRSPTFSAMSTCPDANYHYYRMVIKAGSHCPERLTYSIYHRCGTLHC